jgi:hypothetical protein
VLDPDDGSTASALCADETVKDAREVSRARADIEHACAGAQIRKDEFGGMCVLTALRNVINVTLRREREEGGGPEGGGRGQD